MPLKKNHFSDNERLNMTLTTQRVNIDTSINHGRYIATVKNAGAVLLKICFAVLYGC